MRRRTDKSPLSLVCIGARRVTSRNVLSSSGTTARNANPLSWSSVWLEHLSPAKAPLLRLFCFPCAGGTADLYRTWQRWFPEQIDVCLVHLPGRGKRFRDQPFTRLTPLVTELAGRLRPVVTVPYALYGHSMGAMIAFELARELFARHSAGPRHLFVSGCRAPQWPRLEPVTFNLPHDRFIAELKRLNGTPREVLDNPEVLELFMSLLRADFEVVDTYEYEPGERLACPVTAYGGVSDPRVPVESCSAWQEQTSAGFKVRLFSGDHFFVRDPAPEFVNIFRNDVLSVLAVSPIASA